MKVKNSNFEIVNNKTVELRNSRGKLVFIRETAPAEEPGPPTKKRRAGALRATRRADADATFARIAQELKALAAVQKFRIENGIRHDDGRLGVLGQAAGLLGYRSRLHEASPSLGTLRAWAKGVDLDASAMELRRAFDNEDCDRLPQPLEAGVDIRLTWIEWVAVRPWGIHPFDVPAGTVEAIQAEEKRQRDRARASEKRHATGARPQETSIAAQATKLGVNARSLRHNVSVGPDAVRRFLTKRGVAETEIAEFVAHQYNCNSKASDENGKNDPVPGRGGLMPPPIQRSAANDQDATYPTTVERRSEVR